MATSRRYIRDLSWVDGDGPLDLARQDQLAVQQLHGIRRTYAMRIKRRDGTMAEVADGYILAHGEAMVVGLMMMDSASGR